MSGSKEVGVTNLINVQKYIKKFKFDIEFEYLGIFWNHCKNIEQFSLAHKNDNFPHIMIAVLLGLENVQAILKEKVVKIFGNY